MSDEILSCQFAEDDIATEFTAGHGPEWRYVPDTFPRFRREVWKPGRGGYRHLGWRGKTQHSDESHDPDAQIDIECGQ